MSGRKPGIKEDFICQFCNHYICSKSEYLEADINQRKKWSVYWNIHNKSKGHELKMLKAEKMTNSATNVAKNCLTMPLATEADDIGPIEDFSHWNYAYMYDNLERRVVSVDLNQLTAEESNRYKELSFRNFFDRENMHGRFVMVFKENGSPVEEAELNKMRSGRLIPTWLMTYIRYINSWVKTNEEFKKMLLREMNDTKQIWTPIEMNYRIIDDANLVMEMLKNSKIPMSLEDYRFKVFN